MKFYSKAWKPIDPRTDWHLRFAWLPKKIDEGVFAWLELVEARRRLNPNYHIGGYLWEYRPAKAFYGLLP